VLENGDLLVAVLCHVRMRDLARLACCTTFIRTHALDNDVWRRLVTAEFPAAAGLESAFFRAVYKAFYLRTLALAQSDTIDDLRESGLSARLLPSRPMS
jgi:hypothetical protein